VFRVASGEVDETGAIDRLDVSWIHRVVAESDIDDDLLDAQALSRLRPEIVPAAQGLVPLE
jgi:hypothetical protein